MSHFELDELDKQILNLVIERCDRSIRELSKILDKSPTLVSKRLQRLKNFGIITKCEAVLDYKTMGYSILALILLKVDGAHIEDVEKTLSYEPNVRAVYDITGEFDVALIALFKNVDELDRFVKKILRNPYIKSSTTSVVFKAVKDDINIKVF
ncbi:MAG: Lrp/AsnC family transcriptional regulator [Sulfolobales archaeon]|nr:Lrp/AsnC family transcriptional regulator [Ignisphaera sp.]MCX8199745.1 Lrp/AsnC family transcriptional regulator [Sulfolobales archaeon]MDW8085018.1 Lrp/AsnC family transcriptional regulator [Ignisphaera sp.]